jgi:co-chaperonin GroES (HSP10)
LTSGVQSPEHRDKELTAMVRADLNYKIVAPSKRRPNEWRVEATDYQDGDQVYVATFSGPNAKERAEEYAALKSRWLLVGDF